jgi:hypothetical protein
MAGLGRVLPITNAPVLLNSVEKLTAVANKELQYLQIVIFNLLFLKLLLSRLTGKVDVKSGKVGVFFTMGTRMTTYLYYANSPHQVKKV